MEDSVNGGRGRSRSHVVVFAYPRQGHMSPMIQFSKRLAMASENLSVTFLTASSATQSIPINLSPSSSNLILQVISDVPENGAVASTLEEHFQIFKATVSKSLLEFIGTGSENPPKFLVYDSVMPWVMDIAGELDVAAAPFFTQSAAVNHILYHVHQGSLKIPPENSTVSLPSMPTLLIEDLPSFPDYTEAVIKFMTNQFSNFYDAKWIFSNTFDQLEYKVVNWMAKKWPIKTIGPTIPSAYLDGRLENDKTYGLSPLNPNDEKSYIEWLDSKAISSVIYISFGSLVILKEEQVKELTSCLRDNISFSFLWVLRESELEKLPDDFVRETSDRGLIINWCCQLEVLSHKAVSCFVTHCGWNSTLEALSLGVPMVAIPQWVDQTTNAKFIADVWEVGVRVKKNNDGVATKEEIEASIQQVVQGERRNELKQISIKWKNLAKQAVDEGGSSDKNIEEFVKTIVSMI